MSCGCKNKEYHPCQNGGKCQCGGKCKKEKYVNVAGSIEEFKSEEKNISKAVIQLSGGVILAIISFLLYSKLKK